MEIDSVERRLRRKMVEPVVKDAGEKMEILLKMKMPIVGEGEIGIREFIPKNDVSAFKKVDRVAMVWNYLAKRCDAEVRASVEKMWDDWRKFLRGDLKLEGD